MVKDWVITENLKNLLLKVLKQRNLDEIDITIDEAIEELDKLI